MVIIIQLVGVPILLRAWGAQMYGEWLILAAIPSYLSMVDLGFSQSAANDMTARVAKGDHEGTLVVFQSLSALVSVLVLVGFAACAFLFTVLPVDQWMHFTVISVVQARWTLIFLAYAVLVQLMDGINHAGFRAHGEYAFHTFFYYTTLLAIQAAVWISALAGLGPVWAAFYMLVIRVISTACITFLLFHRHPGLQPGFRYASRKQLRELVNPALANMAMPLAQALNVQGMVLVVGATLGPLAVVVFSTLRTLTRSALQLVLSVSHAFEPELAAAWGSDDQTLLQRLFIANLRLSFWLALSVVLSLFFFGEWIVQTWTHGKVQMDAALYNCLLASALASVLWYAGLNLLKAANRHLRAAFWYVFASLAAILVAAFLLRGSGRLAGAGLALLVMDGLMVAYVLKTASDFIALPAWRVVLSMLDLKSLYLGIHSVFRRKEVGQQVR